MVPAANGCAACDFASGNVSCAFLHGVAGCGADGACTLASCEPGWGDCNGDPSDGCEANLALPQHCGQCGSACGSGQLCAAGGCVTTCAPPLTSCGGSCVNVASDPRFCGSCSGGCIATYGPAATTCTAGTCVMGCEPGYTACPGGGCVDLQNDPGSCGGCSHVCPAPTNGDAICVAGTCGIACQPGWSACNAGCVDTSVDAANCGACGVSCGAAAACVAGACVASSTLLLATGLGAPGPIVLDDAWLYWADPTAGSIARVAKSGGATTTIATGQAKPLGVAVDGTWIYWSNNLGGAVMRAPKDGSGAPEVLAPAATPTDVVVAGGNVYWMGATGLMSVPTTGGTPKVEHSGMAYDLVSDGRFVAIDGFGELSMDSANGKSCSVVGGGNTVDAVVGISPGRVWAERGGNCLAFHVFDAATCAEVAYYGETSRCGSVGVPWRTGRGIGDGCGFVYPAQPGIAYLVQGTAMPTIVLARTATSVALDASFIYWSEPGALGRVRRP